MNKLPFVFLHLVLFLLVGCKYSTSPLYPGKKLTDYSNQYKMIYRFNNNIYSINSDGTSLSKITDFNCHIQNIAVNNEFSKIAFSSLLDGYRLNIYIMDIDGSNLLRVSHYNNDNSALAPKFLSSEQALIYSSDGKLYRVNYDGSETQQITPDSILISPMDSQFL